MRFAVLAFLLMVSAGPAYADPVSAAIAIVGKYLAANAVAAFVARMVATVALSALSKALQRDPGEQRRGIVTDVTLTGGTNPDSFIVGFYATDGVLVSPPLTHGSHLEYLTYVVDLSMVPGCTLSRLFVNGEPVVIGAGSHADYGSEIEGEYNGLIWLTYYDGSQTTADPMLLDKYASDPDFPWSADMIGHGRCYAILTCKFDEKKLSAHPRFRFEINGAPLYDPRKDSTIGGTGIQRWADPSTWEQTNNPAVIAYNVTRGITFFDGSTWGGAATNLPLPSFAAAMNECDVAIELDGGGTEPQYRSGYEIRVDQEPAQVLEYLMSGCSGDMVEVGGEWFIQVGAPPLPVYYMTDETIIVSEAQDLDPWPGLAETLNGVSITYPDPESAWEGKDAPPRYRSDLEELDQGRQLIADLSLVTVPFPVQVQRVGAAYIEDNRRFRKHTLTLPPDAAFLNPLETISWTSVRNGYSDKLFEVGHKETNLKKLLSRVVIQERDPSDYDWSKTQELSSFFPPVNRTVPAPYTLSGVSVFASAITDSFGVNKAPAITLVWTQVESGGIEWQMRTKATGVTAGQGYISGGTTGSHVISEGVLSSTEYEVRALAVFDGVADWTGWFSVTTFDIRPSLADMDGSVATIIATAQARADAAFERHDVAVDDALGTLAELRDLAISSYGPLGVLVPLAEQVELAYGPLDALVPLAEQVELAYGPLDASVPLAEQVELAYGPIDVEVSVSDRLDIEIARLNVIIPQVRSADDFQDRMWQHLIDLQGEFLKTNQTLSDAGIFVDPASGLVRIAATEATNERLTNVEIVADAQAAEIALRATQSYVQDVVSSAILDPTQIPILTGLNIRISSLEIMLAAETGRIDLLSGLFTVEGETVSMATVSATLDSLAEDLSLRVTSEDFEVEVARINGVELTLSTLGDVSTLTQAVTASRSQFGLIEDLTEGSLADLWENYLARKSIRTAESAARREMRAFVDDGFAAGASDRADLVAQIDDARSQIVTETTVRAQADEVAAAILSQLQVELDGVDGDVAGAVEAIDLLTGRVTDTEGLLVAEGESLQFLGASIRALDFGADDTIERSIADIWDSWSSVGNLRDGVAVSMQAARVRVDEGFSAEAEERAILGAAIAGTNASIVAERLVRVTAETALAESITQLTADVNDPATGLAVAFGKITELNTVDATSTSALVQAHLGLSADVNDPTTGLSAAHGEITELNTVDVGSDSVLVQAHLGLAADVNDPTTGLSAAHGEITELNTIDATSTSALVQAYRGLAADVTDPATGLSAAHGEITELNTVDATSTSALVQAHRGLAADVNDPATGLSAAHGEITELNTIDVGSTSAMVQAHLGLAADVNDPTTGLSAAHGEITELNTVDATSTSALVQAHRGLAANVNDPATGLSAAHGEITELNTVDVGSDSALVQAHLGLAADVNDPTTGLSAAHGEITELNTIDATSTSALVQAYRGLAADVNDPATGLSAAHGEITELNTVDATSTSALVQAHRGLAADVNDPTTGLSAAHGEITELNTVDVGSDSALVQAHLGLAADVNDPTTGLSAAHGEITELNTVDATSTSALVQAHRGLAADVNDPTTGLSAAHGEITELNTVDVGSDSALVQAHLGLAADVNDPTTGLSAAHGEITELNTVDATSTSALVQAHRGLAANVNDAATGLSAAHGEITELNTVDATSTSALVQAHRGLAADVNDPATGLSAAHGEITELNTIDVGSTSAMVQAHLGLAADVNDPTTGLSAAHGEITELNTVDATSTSALVQAHRGLAADVNDPATGLSAAHGEITELNTVDVGSDSALVQAHLGLSATVNDPVTGLPAAHGEITELNTVDATSTSALVQAHRGLAATVNDPVTGLSVAHGEITELNNISATSDSVLAQSFYNLDADIKDPLTGLSKAHSRIETIETSYVDSDGAIAAVESAISAEFGSMTAMAEATTFATAQATGISAGYLWRLNGSSVMELVSVDGGTGGSQVTAEIDADYVRISGLTQIDIAVIEELAVSTALVDNLQVGNAQIEGVLESDNYAEDGDGIPTAGYHFDKDTGDFKTAGIVMQRNLVLASGSLEYSGNILSGNTVTLPFVNTGIRIGQNDVWNAATRVLVAQVQIISTASGASNSSLWRATADVYNAFAWFGAANWDSSKGLEFQWSEDPATVISPIWATGNDQRVMMDIAMTTSSINMVGPITINWKIYEVT